CICAKHVCGRLARAQRLFVFPERDCYRLPTLAVNQENRSLSSLVPREGEDARFEVRNPRVHITRRAADGRNPCVHVFLLGEFDWSGRLSHGARLWPLHSVELEVLCPAPIESRAAPRRRVSARGAARLLIPVVRRSYAKPTLRDARKKSGGGLVTAWMNPSASARACCAPRPRSTACAGSSTSI